MENKVMDVNLLRELLWERETTLVILSKNNTGNWLFLISLEGLDQWTLVSTLHESFQKQHRAPCLPRKPSLITGRREGSQEIMATSVAIATSMRLKIRHWITATIQKPYYWLIFPFDAYKSRIWTLGCCSKKQKYLCLQSYLIADINQNDDLSRTSVIYILPDGNT